METSKQLNLNYYGYRNIEHLHYLNNIWDFLTK